MITIDNVNYSLFNDRYYKYFKGSRWMLVYNFNSDRTSFFSGELEAFHSTDPYKYSILDCIHAGLKLGGKYEFLLEYPLLHGYNHWRQSNNPTHEIETHVAAIKTADGYEGIEVSFPDNLWGGLVRSNDPRALLDGSTYNNVWHYSIAPYANNPQYYPGPATNYDGGIAALWIRTAKFFNTCESLSHSTLFFQICLALIITTQ